MLEFSHNIQKLHKKQTVWAINSADAYHTNVYIAEYINLQAI